MFSKLIRRITQAPASSKTAAMILPFLCAAGFLSVPAARAQSLVQVPFGTLYLGAPASTYNGTDSQACTSTTTGYLDFYGDGCPATQATLSLPAGIAIDPLNNLYVADYNDKLIRVVYVGGTNLANLIIAANPKYNISPTPGSVYPITGGGASLASVGGVYYCSGSSGATALNKSGDGCPAQYAYNQARAVGVDREGNIFLAGVQPFNGVRIVYAGGPIGAKLISTYNPTITTPQLGYIYPLSANGDFVSIRGITVDDNDNIYAADTGTQAAVTGLQAATSGNQIKKFSGTGWTTYVPGSTTATAAGVNGDGGAAGSAILTNPLGIYTDHFGNVYFAEGNGRIRVVYNGGTTPPLYVQGANAVVVTAPVAGNVYSVAGGGAARASGSLASTLQTAVSGSNLSSFAIDNSGNLVFTDSLAATYGYTWRVDGRTGVATIIGGAGTKTASYSAATTPAGGVPCNGATGGPVMTDAFDDGCPSTEILPYTPRSAMAFDTAGNFYQAETRTGGTNGIIRKYTFTNQFGSVPFGSTATVPLAFTPATAVTLNPTQSYVITGGGTTEFSDGGGGLCSLSGTVPVQTCTYNAIFKPALAGQRDGAIVLSAAGVPLSSTPIGGTGVAAQLTLDPATQTTLGTGYSFSGTGVDQAGDVYAADATTGNLYKSTNGGAFTQVATGLKNGAQVAVDNSGNVFVADTGNNRVSVAVNVALSTAEQNAINSLTLSGPYGVATDQTGNLYISDTGNNRVLMVTPLGGVSTRAFTGLSGPRGLFVDAAGNIFVADTGNARIVELPAPVALTQAAQTVPTVTPTLITPVAVSVDAAGTLYIADSGNQNVVVVPSGGTSATSLLGSTAGISGLGVDSTGNVFISATSAPGLITLNRTTITYNFPETNVGQTSTRALTLSDSGNDNLKLGSTLGTGTDTTDFSTGTASTGSCSTGQTLLPGQSCAVLATFKPQSKSTTLASTVTFASNSANTTSAVLTGVGVQKIVTSTALTYTTPTGGQPIAGQAFTVTATITPASNVGTLAGSVTFTVDGGSSRTVPVAANAASTSFTLAAGSHTIAATYSGDTNYVSSNNSITVVTVAPAATSTALAVTSAGTPGNGLPFTLTATVTSAASQGAISGNVVFTVIGVTPAQTQTVTMTNGTATASFTLPTGTYNISATYGGNAYYTGSTKTIPVQVVPAGTSSVKLTLVSPTGTISLGQTVVVSAATTTGNSTATPTGTITFTVDGGSAQTFPYATSQTASFSSIPAGTHTITATYSGDNSYAPGSSSISVTVVRATPAAVLTITPNVAASGNSFVIKATLSSSFATPTGTVTLTIAGNPFGTAPLVNGVATFITTTSVYSNYVFSASYSGDSTFLPLTFGSSPSPDFVTALQATTLTTPQYGVALDYITLNSFYGYSGTVNVSCSGLPKNSICRSSPVANTVAKDGVTTVQFQIFLDVDPANASLRPGLVPFDNKGSATRIAVAFGLLFGLPLVGYRRHLGTKFRGLAVALLMFVGIASISGCGSDTRQTVNFDTPTGSYPITFTATDGTTTHTSTLTLVVIPGSPGRP